MKNERGETPRILAARGGHAKAVRALYRAERDVNAQDREGLTALMESARAGCADCVRALVEARADVNLHARSGSTALMYAVRRDRVEIFDALLDAGADLDATDGDTGTALVWAIYYDRPEYARALLERGTDPNVRNKQQGTALMVAAAKGRREMVDLLVERGEDVRARQGGEEAIKGSRPRGQEARGRSNSARRRRGKKQARRLDALRARGGSSGRLQFCRRMNHERTGLSGYSSREREFPHAPTLEAPGPGITFYHPLRTENVLLRRGTSDERTALARETHISAGARNGARPDRLETWGRRLARGLEEAGFASSEWRGRGRARLLAEVAKHVVIAHDNLKGIGEEENGAHALERRDAIPVVFFARRRPTPRGARRGHGGAPDTSVCPKRRSVVAAAPARPHEDHFESLARGRRDFMPGLATSRRSQGARAGCGAWSATDTWRCSRRQRFLRS